MSVFFFVALFCVRRRLVMRRSPVQGVLSKCRNGFIVTEVNSEFEHIRRSNP
jgi:hypothetical protein